MNIERKRFESGEVLRIVEAPSGLFDPGERIRVVSDDGEILLYELIEGAMAEMLDAGECTVGAFFDGSLLWQREQ